MMHRVQAEERIRAELEGADIQARARQGRHPRFIQADERFQRFLREGRVDLRQAETLGGIVHAGEVIPRAEELHLAVRAAVRLQTLENLHAVMQHGRRGRKRNRPVGNNARVMPAFFRRIIHPEHVIGKILAEPQLRFIRVLFGLRRPFDPDIHCASSLIFCPC